MHIRPYRSSDCPALAELFYQTVHAVNARDYSPEQLDAWADGRVELAAWDASFRAHDTRVAVEGLSLIHIWWHSPRWSGRCPGPRRCPCRRRRSGWYSYSHLRL